MKVSASGQTLQEALASALRFRPTPYPSPAGPAHASCRKRPDERPTAGGKWGRERVNVRARPGACARARGAVRAKCACAAVCVPAGRGGGGVVSSSCKSRDL